MADFNFTTKREGVIHNANRFVIKVYSLSSASDMDPFKKIQKVIEAMNLDDITEKAVDIASNIIESITNLSVFDDLQKLLDNFDQMYEIESAKLYNTSSKGKMIAKYIMPLPASLSSDLSHGYEENEATAAETLVRKFPVFLATKAAGIGIEKAATTMVENGIQIAKRHNLVFDPNLINTYSGTDPRTISLSFNLVPFNEDEALELVTGLVTLKKLMTGTQLSSGLFLKQDHIFSIDFDKGLEGWYYFKNRYLNLISMKTDLMTSTGVGSYTYAGIPKTIKLTLDFQERIPLRRADTNTTKTKKKG